MLKNFDEMCDNEHIYHDMNVNICTHLIFKF